MYVTFKPKLSKNQPFKFFFRSKKVLKIPVFGASLKKYSNQNYFSSKANVKLHQKVDPISGFQPQNCNWLSFDYFRIKIEWNWSKW